MTTDRHGDCIAEVAAFSPPYLPAAPDYGGASRRPHGPDGASQRQARVLDDQQVERVLRHIWATSNSPYSDALKIQLSFYAGLRAAEIASLTLDHVCDAEGRIGHAIVISPANSKNRRGRSIPMHPRIREALQRLRSAHPEVHFLAFSNRRGPKKQSVDAVTNWFLNIYREVGLAGCSSHSGRRTFITRLARSANQFNNSLRDVQLIAGHARLDTTERYIDRSDDVAALVASLGAPNPTHLDVARHDWRHTLWDPANDTVREIEA